MNGPIEEVDGCLCVKETARALLILTPAGVHVWVPKSVISDDSEVYAEGHLGVLVVARWFAEKEGLG